jgi:hypothetical protein
LQGFPADLQQRGRLSEQAQSAAVALYLFKGSQQKWTYKIGSQATVVFATLPPPPVLPAKLGGFAHHSFAGQAKPPMQLMRFRQNGETRKQRFLGGRTAPCDQLDESNSLVQ